jgi:WD40 repeat protein
LLAHGQRDGRVSVVELPTLSRPRSFPVVEGNGIEGPGFVEGIAFLPGSHLLVVGGTYGSVALVDVDRGTVVKRLAGHKREFSYRGKTTANPIWTPGVSADGRLVATGSSDGEVRFWSMPDGRPQGAPLRFPYGGIADAQLSPDGRLLSAAPVTRDTVQDRVEIWNVPQRRRVATLRPTAGASSARFSPDGRRLAVSDTRGRVLLYSTATWKPVTGTLTGGKAGWLTFSPDSRTFAAGNADGTVRLWDVRSGQALAAPLPGLPNSFAVPMFTPGGTHLIAAQANGRAFRWDIRPASLIRHACSVAGRQLTRAEWKAFLPGRDYDPAC